MKLFTKDIDRQLFKQFHLGNDLDNQVVVTKIFNPYANMRWFIVNSDVDDPEYLWAIVQMGNNVEVGSVSRSELETIRISKFRLPLERDLGFRPVNAGELLRGLREGKFYKKGGWVENENKEMLENQANEVKHHSEELGNALKNTDHVEAWVVGKMERATTDLSDVTHYLDGESKKMADGGEVDGLKGKVVRYDLLGGGSGMFVVDDVMVSPPYYSKREVSLYTKEGGVDKFPYEKLSDFMSGKSVEVRDSKGEPYTLTLKNRMADGGMMSEGGEVNKYAEVFDKLKKGDKIEMTFGSGISKQNKAHLLVKSKTIVGKGKSYESEKITFENVRNPQGIKFYAYKRKSGYVGFAMGDMAISDVQISFEDKMADGGVTNGMEVVNYLKGVSGLRASYIAEWGDKNNVDLAQVEKAIKTKKLKPIDFSTALSGKDGNKYEKEIIKKYSQNKMAKGGMSKKKTTFDDKVKAIQSSLLKRKKVSPKVQKDYGKTYDKKEALQSAKRIAGAMRKKGKIK